MAHSSTPVFSAVSSSARQLLTLLRCIAPAKKAQVLISAQGLRLSTEEGSVMESFVFLEKHLFTSYTYQPSPPPSSQDDPQDPLFEINLNSLIETLNIFSLSDPAATRRPGGGGGGMEGYDALAAHRLNRHAGINPFSTSAALTSGICSFTYQAPGYPLSIHMSESGVTTTCDLTTYQANTQEEIPFARDALALKAILRSSYLLDAVTELGSMSPETLTLTASSSSRATNTTTGAHSSPCLSLSSSGALGSATVDFTNPPPASSSSSTNPLADSSSDPAHPPILETFFCPNTNKRVQARFPFGLIRSAHRAMAVAQKVSLRLDEEGVLSLQFLIPVMDSTGGGHGGDGNGSGGGGGGDAAAAFVDFRIVPLVEGEEDGEDYDEEETDGNGD